MVILSSIRITCLVVVTALALVLAGCGGGRQANDQTPTPTPTVEDAASGVGGGSSNLERLQAWATVAAALIALGGIIGIIVTLQHGKQQQRIQSGPYIRVDVGPTDRSAEDFEAPKAHFFNQLVVTDLAPEVPDHGKVSLSTWLSNYQIQPLGMALGISAFFALEVRKPDESAEDGFGSPEYFFSLPEVAYLEQSKPVKIELFRFPRDWTATAWLSLLEYHDFFDKRVTHSEGRSTNASHGRLICVYREGSFWCIPVGRPRGPGVDYGGEGQL